MMDVIDALADQVMPHVTKEVAEFGTSVLAAAEDAGTDAALRFGQRILRKLLRPERTRAGMEQAVRALAGALHDPAFKDELREQIKRVLRDDQALADDLRARLGGADGGNNTLIIGGNANGPMSTGPGSVAVQTNYGVDWGRRD